MSELPRKIALNEPAFAALDAIAWLLRQVQQDPDIHEALAGTDTLWLLGRAYGRLAGRSADDVEQILSARHFEDRGLRSRVAVLEELLAQARNQIRELERRLEEVRHVA